ncbi:3-phosphoinositide-dependent protein kinase 1-like [Planoprotostelium fungivorum]|uniref:non-specific serine/threonine protein kinase n=1 Tax=Planoprotostelium fungivorum TaxID=1890364 RepID=A0A2P6NDY8_9EUKA|nr:3-phosphoinositide-dependent protein kinase 1-like [Planoprotostelium fungivorum]
MSFRNQRQPSESSGTEDSPRSSLRSSQSDAELSPQIFRKDSTGPVRDSRSNTGGREPQRMSSDLGAISSKKYVKDFTFGRVLGEGAYGAVVLGKENETGKEYAIKMMEQRHLMKEKKVKYAVTERDILTLCHNNPFIVKLYYTFKDDQYLYYVLELCPNGELLDHISKAGSFEEPCAAFYAAEIIMALEFLHDNGIIHRDLKPENVRSLSPAPSDEQQILSHLILHIKLTDFGTAKIVGKEKTARSNSFVGTAEYVSPELLKEKITSKSEVEENSSDLWALGCIIYQMIAGRPPFRGPSEYVIFEKVENCSYTFPNGFPDTAKDLISRLLVLDPDSRLGFASFSELREHSFFSGIKWEDLHVQTPPQMKSSQIKMVFEEDVVAEEEAKRKKMQEEENEKWKKFLLDEKELILESGLIWKRKGRSVKKRQLILTNKPRLIYVDPKKMVLKGEIPWTSQLKPEAKNNTSWFVHTPKRTYILEDIPGKSQRWIDAINKQLNVSTRD